MDLKSLFINDVPLIDVRAPIEFEAGHFPMSTNLPLMNNEERHLVGTRYKESGQAAAIQLGHELVQGETKAQRITAWQSFIEKHPGCRLYCFRGGLRSQISQQWIRDSGAEIEMIPGGYKALRRYLMQVIAEQSPQKNILLLAGRTGSGKTKLLAQVNCAFMDLEKHAHHKGSSFGMMGPQPTQITFENRIAVDLLKNEASPFLLIEDESVMIGSLVMPRILFDVMLKAPMMVLERPLEERTDHIIDEYVFQKTKDHQGDFDQTFRFMTSSLQRIHRKLGGLNYAKILQEMTDAFQSSERGSYEPHRRWVKSLLLHYYDHFYDRALKRNAERILFQGNEEECVSFISTYTPSLKGPIS